MSQASLTEFFRLAMIFSLGMYSLTAIFSIWFRDFMYQMHKNLFNISRDKFDLIIYCYLGFMKILVILFFVIPYVSLLLLE